MASNLALSMDADPLEDVHRRIKRLEAAVVQSEVGREPVAASTSANQATLPEQTEHSRNTGGSHCIASRYGRNTVVTRQTFPEPCVIDARLNVLDTQVLDEGNLAEPLPAWIFWLPLDT